MGVCCACPCIAVAGALIKLIWLRASLAWTAEDADDSSSHRGGRSDAMLSGKFRYAALVEEGFEMKVGSATAPAAHKQLDDEMSGGGTF